MADLSISGDSFGGSNYMKRLVTVLADSELTQPVVIEVRAGRFQGHVVEEMQQCIAMLENIMSRTALQPLKLNVRVVRGQ